MMLMIQRIQSMPPVSSSAHEAAQPVADEGAEHTEDHGDDGGDVLLAGQDETRQRADDRSENHGHDDLDNMARPSGGQGPEDVVIDRRRLRGAGQLRTRVRDEKCLPNRRSMARQEPQEPVSLLRR